MGIFDAIGNLFGLNLETRVRKAVAVLMILVVVALAMSIIDPIVDRMMQAFTNDDNFNVPFSIPEIMAYVMAVFTPLAPILAYVRDSTIWTVFFVLGLITGVLGIILENTVFGPMLTKLGGFFDTKRTDFEPKTK